MIQQWWTRTRAGGEGSAPLVVCDECTRPIIDARYAIVLFPAWGPTFLHKGRCDRAWSATRPGIDAEGTAELADWLCHLLVNAGMVPSADTSDGPWWHAEPESPVLLHSHQYPQRQQHLDDRGKP